MLLINTWIKVTEYFLKCYKMLSVYGLELRVWGLLFGAKGIGFRVLNLGFITLP